MNNEHKILGLSRIENFLRAHAQQSLVNLLDELLDYSISYSNQQRLDDDATLLGLEVLSIT